MKKSLYIFCATLMAGSMLQAQELPQPSPAAEVEQNVGLTELKVVYSRPSMRDREIFGNLVPYGKMWRTGANANTTIEFNTPVTFDGATVEAGKYSLYTIPGENAWQIILNKKTDSWGTNGYTEEMDVLRTQAPVQETGMMAESFTIGFQNVSGNSAHLIFRWSNVKVAVPFSVNVEEKVAENIEKALAETEEEKLWGVHRNIASYYLNSGQAEEANQYIDKSLSMHEGSWYSFWLKAEIMAEMEQYEEAIAFARQSMEIGEKSAREKEEEFRYAEMIAENMEKWQGNM